MSKIKNFSEFYINENSESDDLIKSIQEYLEKEYPESWWNNEFNIKVYDYISEDDLVGYGDPDDESTWDYESEEDAYRNLSTGGAIEYDLLDEIGKDIQKKFNLSSDDYYKKYKISDLVNNYMVKTIDWYDEYLFGEKSNDFLGTKKSYDELTKNWNDPSDGIKL